MGETDNENYSLKKLSSPVATGGQGVRLEHEVGAFYLALLLLNAVPRGLDGGVITEVRFQQLYDKEPLDDIVVIAQLPDGDAKLAIQYKRDLAFGESDKNFDEVLRACWEKFKSPDFRPGRDRLGIGLALYNKIVDEHYQGLLSWARHSANATYFLERISRERLSSGYQRNFLELIRNKLSTYSNGLLSDDDLWNFLRSIVILRFDFHAAGSADYHYTVELLRTALPAEQKLRAEEIFGKLDKYAGEAVPTAGGFNFEQLRDRLLSEGVSLSPAPNCLGDLRRLNDHARYILAEIRNDIGGIRLNRTSLAANAQAALTQHRLLEIIGPPGSGKSALLKALIENAQGQGGVLVLLIFIRQGRTLLTDQWRHAKLFIPCIDQWVETAGTSAERYSVLLILLDVHAENFGVKTALRWLSQMAQAADDDFWRQNDNGNRTGEKLAHLWAIGGDEIRGDSESLTAYSRLVDRLVIAGVSVANVLQHSLETRRDG